MEELRPKWMRTKEQEPMNNITLMETIMMEKAGSKSRQKDLKLVWAGAESNRNTAEDKELYDSCFKQMMDHKPLYTAIRFNHDPRYMRSEQEWRNLVRCNLDLHDGWKAKGLRLRLARLWFFDEVDGAEKGKILFSRTSAKEISWDDFRTGVESGTSPVVQYAIDFFSVADWYADEYDFECNDSLDESTAVHAE